VQKKLNGIIKKIYLGEHKMKKKGFTLVELLVVIAIIALLMGILMPALARVRALAQRVVCGTNQSSAGKAMMLYANEYGGKYVRAGGMNSIWGAGPGNNWAIKAPARESDAFGMPPGKPATIGSHFYYLIKYADATPKIFICGGDVGAREFKLSDPVYRPAAAGINSDLTLAWDFGNSPQQHYSYALQVPFGAPGSQMGYFPLTSLSDPGMAVMADRNPYLALTVEQGVESYVWRGSGGSKDTEKWGNSVNHKREGQNVLFNDGHVSFSDVPNVGVDDDNIYSIQSISYPVEVGTEPWPNYGGGVLPLTRTDSVLINEGLQQGDISTSAAPPPS